MVLDTQTRWNSLLNMLKRFINGSVCIQKALLDLNQLALFPTEPEILQIQKLVLALEIVEYGVTSL